MAKKKSPEPEGTSFRPEDSFYWQNS